MNVDLFVSQFRVTPAGDRLWCQRAFDLGLLREGDTIECRGVVATVHPEQGQFSLEHEGRGREAGRSVLSDSIYYFVKAAVKDYQESHLADYFSRDLLVNGEPYPSFWYESDCHMQRIERLREMLRRGAHHPEYLSIIQEEGLLGARRAERGAGGSAGRVFTGLEYCNCRTQEEGVVEGNHIRIIGRIGETKSSREARRGAEYFLTMDDVLDEEEPEAIVIGRDSLPGLQRRIRSSLEALTKFPLFPRQGKREASAPPSPSIATTPSGRVSPVGAPPQLRSDSPPPLRFGEPTPPLAPLIITRQSYVDGEDRDYNTEVRMYHAWGRLGHHYARFVAASIEDFELQTLLPEEIGGYPVVGFLSVQRGERDREERSTPLSREQLESTKRIGLVIDRNANWLMRKHSQLQAISTDGASLICYVPIKGAIPLGEEKLRREVDGVPITIEEGDYQPCGVFDRCYDPIFAGVSIGCALLSNEGDPETRKVTLGVEVRRVGDGADRGGGADRARSSGRRHEEGAAGAYAHSPRNARGGMEARYALTCAHGMRPGEVYQPKPYARMIGISEANLKGSVEWNGVGYGVDVSLVRLEAEMVSDPQATILVGPSPNKLARAARRTFTTSESCDLRDLLEEAVDRLGIIGKVADTRRLTVADQALLDKLIEDRDECYYVGAKSGIMTLRLDHYNGAIREGMDEDPDLRRQLWFGGECEKGDSGATIISLKHKAILGVLTGRLKGSLRPIVTATSALPIFGTHENPGVLQGYLEPVNNDD
jgi:hypothetical protein